MSQRLRKILIDNALTFQGALPSRCGWLHPLDVKNGSHNQRLMGVTCVIWITLKLCHIWEVCQRSTLSKVLMWVAVLKLQKVLSDMSCPKLVAACH